MRYGLPYKGSKNAIAEWVVNQLPSAECFVDLFFGGGAITHRALLSHKYRKFIINDIDCRLPKLFLDCVHGKYTVNTRPEWVSREDFNRLKNGDAYIALIWSFGNNGKDYMYGADIEEYKHAYHVLVFDNNPKPLESYGVKVKMSRHSDPYMRYLDYAAQIKDFFGAIKEHKRELENFERLQTVERLENFERLQTVERLENFERLQTVERLESLCRLQSLQSDYQDVKLPDNAVIYCDPPYANTNCGKYAGFDSKRFYEWADKQDSIFISEYAMPEPFIPIAHITKPVLSANGNGLSAKECLFTNQRTWAAFDDDTKQLYRANAAEQICFW